MKNTYIKNDKLDIKALLELEGAENIVTEKNKPNIKLMAQAFINLEKESIK